MSDENGGVQHYIKSTALRMASANTEEIIEELEKALELGLSSDGDRLDALFTLGLSYAMIGARAPEDRQKELYKQGMDLMEQALVLDAETNHGYFLDSANREKLELLDLIYLKEQHSIADNDDVIAYLQAKSNLFDHIPSPPILITLCQLAASYHHRGGNDDRELAKIFWRKVVEAEPVTGSESESKARRFAQEGLQQLIQEKHSSNFSQEEVKGTGNKSGCYIATACYGSYDAPEVQILRTFRDKKLVSSCWGRCFIRLYYRYSPYWADKLHQHTAINRLVRVYFLDTFVKRLREK